MATSGGNPFPPAPPPPGRPWPGDVTTASGGTDADPGNWTVIVKRHRCGPSGLVALWAVNTLIVGLLATSALNTMRALSRDDQDKIQSELDEIDAELERWRSR